MSQTVLFTFDYELFLGDKSGKPGECMIKPTARLLELLDHFGFRGIFFVDTVYLMRLEESLESYKNAIHDLNSIREQLGEIVKRGHYIFPHIHPHWLDAVYEPSTGEWSLLNLRYYQFSSVPLAGQRTLFGKSVQIIGDIARKISPAYEVDSYRAGGWTIQPFDAFRPYFEQYGIRHEWSVIPGRYLFSDAHSFDFREAPLRRPVYRFNGDPCREDKDGPFTEWTISSLSLNRLETWIDFKTSGILKRLGKMPAMKGFIVNSPAKEEGDSHAGKNIMRYTASFEGLNPFRVARYISDIKKSGYFQFISHPKLLTPFEFKMMERLFRGLKKKCRIETDFKKRII